MESIKVYTRQQVLSMAQTCLSIVQKQQQEPMDSDTAVERVFTQRDLISQIYNAFLKQKSEESSPFQQLKGEQQRSKRKVGIIGAKNTSDTLLYSEEDIMWVICHAVYLMSQERYSSPALWSQYIELALQKCAERGHNPLE